MREVDLWTNREKWLHEHQPAYTGPEDASVLLTQIQDTASKSNVLVENPAINSGESTAAYQSVFANVETKSPWPPLVHFLYDVQQPESFIVFENVNLAVDGNDPTQMRGRFKVARWYAPNGGNKTR